MKDTRDLKHKEEFMAVMKNQDVKDVEAAYKAVCESERVLAVRLRQARQDQQRAALEVKLHFDNVASITGLKPGSRLFMKIAGATLGAKLRRARVAMEEVSLRQLCPLMDGFEEEPDPFMRGDL